MFYVLAEMCHEKIERTLKAMTPARLDDITVATLGTEQKRIHEMENKVRRRRIPGKQPENKNLSESNNLDI